ncbi:hypothetical protein H4R33_005711 [Dimargaris cristalligena]|nr:hypothetical protein H4R33_005711 [Dimargaris cristalligena]
MVYFAAIQNYQAAAAIVQEVLRQVIERTVPGTKISTLCIFGDQLIEDICRRVSPGVKADKGIAFPTSVAINHRIQNVAASADMDMMIQVNDVVKIELAVHINGYVASQAHTVVMSANPNEPVSDRRADVICAAKITHEATLRKMRAGVKAEEITNITREVAEFFQCSPVESTYSQAINRYVFSGQKSIPNRYDVAEGKADLEFEIGDVFVLNTCLSTGTGKARDSGMKPTVCQRDVNRTYYFKMKSAADLFETISKNHPVFPFAVRNISDLRQKLGLTECLGHGVINSLPMLVERKERETVAQFQTTVLITHEGPMCLTPPQTMSYVHSNHNIPADSHILALINQNMGKIELPRLSDIHIKAEKVSSASTMDTS